MLNAHESRVTNLSGTPRLPLIAVLAGLALLSIAVSSRDITVGGFSWSDAPLHAMDGVFLHDLVRAWPDGSWKAWAEQYYLKHQCLGIGVYYPPMFAAVEAGMFSLFGISVTVARFTVVLFVVAAIWTIFLLGRELFDTKAGIAAAVLALVSSAGTAWSRQVMLEWPSVFWIALALLAYVHLSRTHRWRWGLLVGAACLAAYLTKQTAGFVIAVIVAHVLWARRWHLVRHPAYWAPLAGAAILVVAYAKATSGLNALAPMLIAGTPPWRHLISLENWWWYLGRLPAMLGWPVVMCMSASCAALALCRWRLAEPQPGRRSDEHPARSTNLVFLPVFWLFGWWLISSAIAAKEERYFFFAVPALALVFGWALSRASRLDAPAPRWLGRVGGAFLAVGIVMAIRTSALRLSDMRPTVAFLAAQPDADLVLVDAVRDGQLIFDVRTMSTPTRAAAASRSATSGLIPMRASKLLYSRAARTRYGYAQHVASIDEIAGILDELGIRYIVLEDRLPTPSHPSNPAADEDRSWDTPPRLMLRELVSDTSRFERVFSQPLKCQDPIWDDVNLVTYRYKSAPPRRTRTIRLPIPAMGKDIELNLDR